MLHFNIFKVYYFVLLCILLLFSCHTKPSERANVAETSFKTTDSSLLFFKNLRQSYYDKEENTVAKADIYRKQDRNKAQTMPIINLAIVHHWRNEKAYIMVEPSELLADEVRLEVTWQSPEGKEQGSYFFDFGDMEMHRKFATSLYKSVEAEHVLMVKSGKKWLELMVKEEEKDIFRITMIDYLSLVNAAK
ncbi:MAG: hypothetical protein EAZ08_08550 [Cytophagales bacterium]|nr:MAG: hypothetical protein EAZ08_08550 [Cytophagales bacterium]